MYRHVLATRQNFIDEIMEQPYVKKCKVVEKDYKFVIYVKISIVDYIFRMSKILDDIHSILRPKAVLTITYEVKPKLFL
jgi:hypothetical protein